jgi:hypothetical protein
MRYLNRLKLLVLISASVSLTVTPTIAAQKAWTGAGDSLWSSGGNWSPAGAPGAGDNVVFTNTGTVANPGAGTINNGVDVGFAASLNSLAYMNTNGYHNTGITNPLQVISSSATDVAFVADDGRPAVMFVGSGQADGIAANVYAAMIGSSLVVSNGNADLSVMQINGTDNAGYWATLDLAGLDALTCTVSNVQVAVDTGAASTRPHGTLLLAKTNVVTAANLLVADVFSSGSSQTSRIRLGQTNRLNVDMVRVGLRKMRGTMNFNDGLTAPVAVFRNAAGTGRVVAWEVGDINGAGGSSSQTIGIMDFTGGAIDALVERITVGRGQEADGQGDGTGTLTIGGGTVDANTFELGLQQFAGRSAGRGTLNLNNDAGVGPALLKVNNDVTMAVQLVGNTDVVGSTATINVNGGTLAVAGNIVDGDGLSTISLNSGGTVDLQPSGDPTAGNIAVDNLIVSDGTVTNYNLLAVTNISLVGPATQFTVYSGQSIAPSGAGVVGPLSVSGDLRLRGATELDINKTGGNLSADLLTVSGTADLGGTLNVTLSGDAALTAGDSFTLLNLPTVLNAFTTVNLPPLDSGLAWVNNLLVDGSILVSTVGSAPSFTTQPSPAAVTAYSNATFNFKAVAVGDYPVHYRWQIDSVNVAGATNSSVSVAALALSPGAYTVRLQASNALGTALSDPVALTIVTNPPVAAYFYADSFSRVGALNGTSPDLTNVPVATWTAEATFATDGSKLVFPTTAPQGYLPFTPQWGHVYVLSAEINGTNPSSEWQALGFAETAQINSGGFFVGSTGFILVRANHAEGYSFINGLGNPQSFPIFNPTGPGKFSLVLDTTTGDQNANTGWTLRCVQDGVIVTTTVYAANPTVRFVGLGGSASAAGLFDNFSLSDSAPISCAAHIVSQPVPVEVYAGSLVPFTASASGSEPIYYQWRFNGTNIVGATSTSLTLSNVTATQAGGYSVVASNFCGSSTSSVATLTVRPVPLQYDIYFDDFAGTDSTPLNGRTPLVNELNATWMAQANLQLQTNLLFCPPGGANQGAFLPFTPQWGHIYVLSVDLNPLVNSSEWLEFGFTPDADVELLAPSLGGGPWMLQRADRSSSFLFSLGFVVAGTGSGGNAVGPTSWKLVLDTTTGDTNANTGWTATLVEGQTNAFGRIIASHVYTAGNPPIGFAHVGNESSVGISGTFDNFRLTDSVEPDRITITGGGSSVTLTWPRGALLEAPTVNGPWTTNSATSPYTFSPTEVQKFYRAQVQ